MVYSVSTLLINKQPIWFFWLEQRGERNPNILWKYRSVFSFSWSHCSCWHFQPAEYLSWTKLHLPFPLCNEGRRRPPFPALVAWAALQPSSDAQNGGSAAFHPPPPSAPRSLWDPASFSPTDSAGPTINLCGIYSKWCWAELPRGRRGGSPWLGAWVLGERDGEEWKRGEQDLLSLALRSHSCGFTTCATTAFKQLLYIPFCLLFLLQCAARKGYLLFADKEETHGPFGVISLIC